MDTSYGIFEYHINNLCTYISYQTDTPLSNIKQKPQITYLDNYFNYFKDKKIFFIYENEYIDQHYLEDYAYYYVRCFQTYKKTCSRIHFFQTDNTTINYKQEFKQALQGEPSFINNTNYLGYIIIRPIPQTFLAKICLKPYYLEQNRFTKYILTKKYTVSLFGILLEIKSIAFQEQDKVISACATTSLWSFFHAHPNMNLLHLPSSSTITKSAYDLGNGHNREFPNSGLSTDMICRSLKANNFSPEYFEFSDENTEVLQQNNLEVFKDYFNLSESKHEHLNDNKFNLLKEYIYAYCSSDIPIILGVSVRDFDTHVEKGLHAVTILGYSLEDKQFDTSLIAHRLEKIYVHDDRFGPFLRILLEDNQCKVLIDKNNEVTNNQIFNNEIYTPDTLIIGVYHKIRIPYLTIKNTCLVLTDLFSIYLLDNGFEEESNIIQSFKWDIHIKQNHGLKHSILNSDIKNKESYLTKSWPKYIWSATARFSNTSIFEMIFDATDINQGNVFLDIIPINLEYSESIIKSLEIYSNKSFNHKIKEDFLYENSDNLIWGIKKYFRKKESYLDSLNDTFGYLKIPRNIKNQEIHNDEIINQCDIRLNNECNPEEFTLNKSLSLDNTYIWVIDKEGFLCIGIEANNSSQGHPTLTDGMPARIGGQITFNQDLKIWEIDPFSGRYSSEYTTEEKIIFLSNAIKYKFNLYFPSENFQSTQLN